MDSYRAGDLTFPVIDSGPPDGEAVVLLHGFPQAGSSWSALTQTLTAAGYRVLAPDQRGYSPGALPKGRREYAMPHLVADVLALLDAAGLEKAHIVGHDWGGAVAWSLAAKAPERVLSLTVLSTPHPAAMAKAALTGTQGFRSWYMLFNQLPWLPETLLNPATEAGRKRFIQALRRSGQTPEEAERDADAMAKPGVFTGALNWYRALPFGGRVSGPIAVPTLFIWGNRDAFLGRKAAELTADYVKGPYTFLELDAGHWLQDHVAEPLLTPISNGNYSYGQIVQPLLPGDPPMVGAYRLGGRLGAGGMGVVYLAHTPSGRRVAVKVIRGELAGDPDFRSRFRREVAAARGVHSAFTAPVIDADTEADQPWLATVYVPGPSLLQRITSDGPLQAPEAWALGAGLAEAIGAIHQSGVIHRDLKPANVILAEDGPRVIDFGIAKAAAGTVVTQTGVLVGSPSYMAPEYVRGQDAGPPSDVFALAGTVAFAVTGRSPYGEGPAEVILMRLLHDAPDLSGIDPQLAAVLKLAMNSDPGSRPDALTLLSIFADGANRRGATMSYPRPAPVHAPQQYSNGPGFGPGPTAISPAGPAALAGPDWRFTRLWVSLLIAVACLVAGVAAYLIARHI